MTSPIPPSSFFYEDIYWYRLLSYHSIWDYMSLRLPRTFSFPSTPSSPLLSICFFPLRNGFFFRGLYPLLSPRQTAERIPVLPSLVNDPSFFAFKDPPTPLFLYRNCMLTTPRTRKFKLFPSLGPNGLKALFSIVGVNKLLAFHPPSSSCCPLNTCRQYPFPPLLFEAATS